jgi:SAM-dependent methyltransferase
MLDPQFGLSVRVKRAAHEGSVILVQRDREELLLTGEHNLPLYTAFMSDWDAARYHRVSDPQLAWGRTVAARLAPSAGERVLDIGCGTGRLTAEIAAAPGIFVVGLDRSAAMLEQAAAPHAQERAQPGHTRSANGSQMPGGDSFRAAAYVWGDGAELPFAGVFDAVFSAATFHWIADHQILFHSIYGALKPGGRLVAQCGGAGNLERLGGRARSLMREPRYSPYFASWTDPWYFENVADTESRLDRAGFTAIDVSLVAAPVTFADRDTFAEFIGCVCVRHHLDRLPAAEREPFVDRLCDLAAADDPAFTLDYWRLNISARKGRS